MKSKPLLTLFAILSLLSILVLTPVFGQYQEVSPPSNQSSSPTAGISLGNMGVSSVGNIPVMGMTKGTSSDGSEHVTVSYAPAIPATGQPLSITLSFTDASGNLIHHQNYAISVVQDGNEVFSDAVGHTHTGNDMQTTNNLPSSNPIDIKVTLNGIGLPGTDPSTWTGPKGDVLIFHVAQVVPEFGPIAGMIITLSVISVVVISRKSKFSF